MWIEELNRELFDRMLAIWEGKDADGTPIDMPEAERQELISQWKTQAANAKKGGVIGKNRTGFRHQAKAARTLCKCRNGGTA